MNKIWIALLVIIIGGCKTQSSASSTSSIKATNSQQVSGGEIIVRLPEGTQNATLSQQEINEIRSLLDVYYTGNKSAWSASRQKIIAKGPMAKKALCLFFIKFFAAGRQSVGDIEKHWRAARYELSQQKEFAVPFLIATMAVPKLGTTGKIQCSKTLAKIGKPALPALIENVGRGDASFQRRVIETLGEIKNQQAITPLANLYNNLSEKAKTDSQDEQYGIRFYIVNALGDIRWNKESATTIERALSDPNREVRKAAIESSISMAAPQNVALLQKARKTSRKDFPLSKYHTRIEVLLEAYK
ncbi:HEAT repeat domain-containing protein [Candidatus Uabimicrobium amorphum]|uniref:HEAT repeat domain-containing protein n=1 Tax=Uabimicrobium amorphum TaxID=2596890 RepID=A0A5S9IHR1_UABAM|nr:HEAT repeat domain-containing protein [Candidatus Uabimicrobium amorphum]BBM82038.1 hypothetical protein UABAM_00381 [Candidatus Uabimicrobium amorphum]